MSESLTMEEAGWKKGNTSYTSVQLTKMLTGVSDKAAG